MQGFFVRDRFFCAFASDGAGAGVSEAGGTGTMDVTRELGDGLETTGDGTYTLTGTVTDEGDKDIINIRMVSHSLNLVDPNAETPPEDPPATAQDENGNPTIDAPTDDGPFDADSIDPNADLSGHIAESDGNAAYLLREHDRTYFDYSGDSGTDSDTDSNSGASNSFTQTLSQNDATNGISTTYQFSGTLNESGHALTTRDFTQYYTLVQATDDSTGETGWYKNGGFTSFDYHDSARAESGRRTTSGSYERTQNIPESVFVVGDGGSAGGGTSPGEGGGMSPGGDGGSDPDSGSNESGAPGAGGDGGSYGEGSSNEGGSGYGSGTSGGGDNSGALNGGGGDDGQGDQNSDNSGGSQNGDGGSTGDDSDDSEGGSTSSGQGSPFHRTFIGEASYSQSQYSE
ncbi:MAG: hypothetical protein AAFN70_15330, partial [Planctomycetota bacterium]